MAFTIEIDGNDIVVRDVIVTSFGGGHDPGDDGQTESGVLNNGSNPYLLGCALPIRSTEAATAPSPFSDPNKPHIPWGTKVLFWSGNDESEAVETELIDNGPDVAKYPNHAADLTVYAASKFNSSIPIDRMADDFEATLSYRVVGGAPFVAGGS